MKPIIQVRDLSKRYRIGAHRARYGSLRESLTEWGRQPFRALRKKDGQQHPTIWALKNVTFDVMLGEIVGIIGRNGAGKSTLLKVLSRITEPTEGEVDLYGRVGSLLEVGTGFHPELTGRENIFLSGAVLGMKRAEIDRKFDEMVAFAEVEKFIDTAVKRYSSGMYMRLAFSVAAHLEPEILLVDEVLAIGDAEFQKKCLGKMQSVAAGEGRTVLFVSHNMDAIARLCRQALLLDNGRVLCSGDVPTVINAYLRAGINQVERVSLRAVPRPLPVRGQAKIVSARMVRGAGPAPWKLPFGENICFELEVEASSSLRALEVAVAVVSPRGFEIASCASGLTLGVGEIKKGLHTVRIRYLDLCLVPGLYRFGLGIRSPLGFEDYLPEAFELEIVPSSKSAEMRVDTFLGAVVPNVAFELEPDAAHTQEPL